MLLIFLNGVYSFPNRQHSNASGRLVAMETDAFTWSRFVSRRGTRLALNCWCTHTHTLATRWPWPVNCNKFPPPRTPSGEKAYYTRTPRRVSSVGGPLPRKGRIAEDSDLSHCCGSFFREGKQIETAPPFIIWNDTHLMTPPVENLSVIFLPSFPFLSFFFVLPSTYSKVSFLRKTFGSNGTDNQVYQIFRILKKGKDVRHDSIKFFSPPSKQHRSKNFYQQRQQNTTTK